MDFIHFCLLLTDRIETQIIVRKHQWIFFYQLRPLAYWQLAWWMLVCQLLPCMLSLRHTYGSCAATSASPSEPTWWFYIAGGTDGTLAGMSASSVFRHCQRNSFSTALTSRRAWQRVLQKRFVMEPLPLSMAGSQEISCTCKASITQLTEQQEDITLISVMNTWSVKNKIIDTAEWTRVTAAREEPLCLWPWWSDQRKPDVGLHLHALK